MPVTDRPSGTVSFLLTGVADSAGLWEASADAAAEAIRRYSALVDAAVSAHGGDWPAPHRGGDRALVAFGSATGALAAALTIQRTLAAEPWPEAIAPRVRIGVHSGEATPGDDGTYSGAAVDRCARPVVSGVGPAAAGPA